MTTKQKRPPKFGHRLYTFDEYLEEMAPELKSKYGRERRTIFELIREQYEKAAPPHPRRA